MSAMIKVDTLDNIFEAQRLDAALSERGIPHIIETYHDNAYDGLFQSTRGWGSVKAPAAQAKRVLEILEDLRNDVS